MTRQRSLLTGVIVITLIVSGVNGYWLQHTYTHYRPSTLNEGSLSTVKVIPKTSIVSAKQKALDNGRIGQKAGDGHYSYVELSHSKVNDSQSVGQLMLASEQQDNANFVLAGKADTNAITNNLNPGWGIQAVNQDTIWQPASCASKPTYLIGGRYIFIDDGKTKASDKYNSYLVFDMVSQKFRYFGGDNFTAQQGDKEHILSVQNENGTIVFYIDQSDTTGPLAGNGSFKHNADHAPGYITRRVIDLNTLQYTDYKIPYSLPASVAYFFIDAGSDFGGGQIATLSPEPQLANGYYAGIVTNNALAFQLKYYDSNPQFQITGDSQKDITLDDQLANALPSFTEHFDALAANSTKRFRINDLGTQAQTEYLIASQAWAPDGNLFDSPVVYNMHTHQVNAMMSKPVLSSYVDGNYVPLGVF